MCITHVVIVPGIKLYTLDQKTQAKLISGLYRSLVGGALIMMFLTLAPHYRLVNTQDEMDLFAIFHIFVYMYAAR